MSRLENLRIIGTRLLPPNHFISNARFASKLVRGETIEQSGPSGSNEILLTATGGRMGRIP